MKLFILVLNFYFFLATTIYSLNAVCCSYKQMRMIDSQNIALVDAEKLPNYDFWLQLLSDAESFIA